ncbi:Gti1/Pac2 family-domain-containing protein, partial [Chytriomyces sp. MP71]
MTSQAHQLQVIETFFGHIKTVQDAECVVEACLAGLLPIIRTVPVILSGLAVRSGTIIVFPEITSSTQLTRWRDGGRWSASRICGHFLLYREIEKPAKGGVHQGQGSLLPKNPYSRATSGSQRAERNTLFTTLSLRKNTTLVPNGLAKTTITITGSDGQKYRVINYFYPEEVEHLYPEQKSGGFPRQGTMKRPSDFPDLAAIHQARRYSLLSLTRSMTPVSISAMTPPSFHVKAEYPIFRNPLPPSLPLLTAPRMPLSPILVRVPASPYVGRFD